MFHLTITLKEKAKEVYLLIYSYLVMVREESNLEAISQVLKEEQITMNMM